MKKINSKKMKYVPCYLKENAHMAYQENPASINISVTASDSVDLVTKKIIVPGAVLVKTVDTYTLSYAKTL